MDTVIKWTNRIIIFSILIMLYWTFTAISIGVFGFKVFRENTTELFFSSIFGILTIIFGAAIANVTANLTKISTAVSIAGRQPVKESKDRKSTRLNSSHRL